jgi:Flp pilus assembly protein TadG
MARAGKGASRRRFVLRLAAHRRGTAAIEFAVVAPIMLLLGSAIFEIGSLLRANAVVNRLVMQYAISYADCSDTSSGVCGTEVAEYGTSYALGNIVPQLTAANLTLDMAQVKMNGATPTVEYSYPAGFTLTTAQITALQATVASGQTGVVVTATYPYQLLVFSTLMSPFFGSNFSFTYTAVQLK